MKRTNTIPCELDNALTMKDYLEFRKSRILIIEDERLSAAILGASLNPGYTVDTYLVDCKKSVDQTIADLTEVTKSNSYDLFIIDINLKVFSGVSAGAILRSASFFSKPIIYISGNSKSAEFLEDPSGKTYFLKKPISDVDLAKRVSELLTKKVA